jgi:hypothetical protein
MVLKVQEKDSKIFFWYIIPFIRVKKIFKFFPAAVRTRYYHPKKIKKTQVVPGTKNGVFR